MLSFTSTILTFLLPLSITAAANLPSPSAFPTTLADLTAPGAAGTFTPTLSQISDMGPGPVVTSSVSFPVPSMFGTTLAVLTSSGAAGTFTGGVDTTFSMTSAHIPPPATISMMTTSGSPLMTATATGPETTATFTGAANANINGLMKPVMIEGMLGLVAWMVL